jgi:hypothetical protein
VDAEELEDEDDDDEEDDDEDDDDDDDDDDDEFDDDDVELDEVDDDDDESDDDDDEPDDACASSTNASLSSPEEEEEELPLVHLKPAGRTYGLAALYRVPLTKKPTEVDEHCILSHTVPLCSNLYVADPQPGAAHFVPLHFVPFLIFEHLPTSNSSLPFVSSIGTLGAWPSYAHCTKFVHGLMLHARTSLLAPHSLPPLLGGDD